MPISTFSRLSHIGYHDDGEVTSLGTSSPKGLSASSSLQYTFFGQIISAFVRFDGFNIPPKAVINSATLKLLAELNTDGGGGFLHARAYLLAKDGRWDAPNSNLGWAKAHSWTTTRQYEVINVQLQDSGGSGLSGVTTTSTSGSVFDLKSTAGNPSDACVLNVGQVMKCSVAGTLGKCTIRLAKSGSPTGNVRLKVYAADGSGYPTGSVLATSDDIVASSLTTGGNGTVETFNFSGGNQISLTLNAFYAVIVDADHAVGTDVVRVRILPNGDPYADGTCVCYGPQWGFTEAAYPLNVMLPHEFQSDLSTPLVTPYANTALNIEIPSWTTLGVQQDITGLDSLIQAWVNDPAYIQNDVIAIGMQPRFHDVTIADGPQVRGWTTENLVIDWGIPAGRSDESDSALAPIVSLLAPPNFTADLIPVGIRQSVSTKINTTLGSVDVPMTRDIKLIVRRG